MINIGPDLGHQLWNLKWYHNYTLIYVTHIEMLISTGPDLSNRDVGDMIVLPTQISERLPSSTNK